MKIDPSGALSRLCLALVSSARFTSTGTGMAFRMLWLLLGVILSLLATEAPVEGGSSVSYTYDDAGRLKQIIDGDGNVATYEYDAVGNILSIRQGTPACPLQPPAIREITSTVCYAGASCRVTIEGDSLLGASVSTGTRLATLSDCHTDCGSIVCVLSTSPSLAAGPITVTATTIFGSAQSTVQIVAPPSIGIAGGAGIWHFAANGGLAVTISMTRIANQPDGSSTLDPLVELRDSRGFLVAGDDDSGSADPRGPGRNALIQNAILPATDTYEVIARGSGGTVGPYVLSIVPSTIVLVQGPPPVTPPPPTFTFSGAIRSSVERDTYTFAANSGSVATIEVDRIANNPDGTGTLDPAVELRDSRGILLRADDDGGTNAPPGPGRNAIIKNITLPTTDTYTIVVFGSGGTEGPYDVKVLLQ